MIDYADRHVTESRIHLAELADTMLRAAMRHGCDSGAHINIPGVGFGPGEDIDGLEGFARSFLLAGLKLASDGGVDALGLREWFSRGVIVGTDRRAPDRWVRMSGHSQPKVEAATIALTLDMTRPWIWDSLDSDVKVRVVDYLSEAVGNRRYGKTNWVWFRLIVQTFLRSVGGPHDLEEMRRDLMQHDAFARSDGWIADGEPRAFDHYCGWAMQFYPILWGRMNGAEDLVRERQAVDRDRLEGYLEDAIHLVGTDRNGHAGSPLIQGRSLTYRFACAAPFWLGGLVSVENLQPGQLRRAALGIVDHFAKNGAPDDNGLLNVGWHEADQAIAQNYSGPSSPYWAVKGLLGLVLPERHPIWTEGDVALPIETSDYVRAIESAGWLVSGTVDDGIVRVVNHGTDNACEGDVVGDAPWYSRLGYSTATFPWVDGASWASPADNSVGLVDRRGRSTHRSGFRKLGVRVESQGSTKIAVGGSRAVARWLVRSRGRTGAQFGWRGTFENAGVITTLSLVRRGWEVRLACVDELFEHVAESEMRLRMTGWPVVEGDGLRSAIIADEATEAGFVYASTHDGRHVGSGRRFPYADFRLCVGKWVSALIVLDRRANEPDPAVSVSVEETTGDTGVNVRVRWPDSVTTSTLMALPAPHVGPGPTPVLSPNIASRVRADALHLCRTGVESVLRAMDTAEWWTRSKSMATCRSREKWSRKIVGFLLRPRRRGRRSCSRVSNSKG